MKYPKQLWAMSPAAQQQTRLIRYMRWLKRHYKLDFADYDSLYQWSVENPAEFWQTLWQYFNIKSFSPYKKVLSDGEMPYARWFEGATLNYVEHIFQGKTDFSPAIKFLSENTPLSTISWEQLESQVASMSAFLKQKGVSKGDRVVAYLPNIPEAVVAFLATASLGAIWSSASPDFGTASVIDRFAQIEPKVLFATDGYTYGGKSFNRMTIVEEIAQQLPTLENVVIVPFLDKKLEKLSVNTILSFVLWQNALATESEQLVFEPVEFAHPLYILFSSGTTGIPKAIVHGHGGVLLEHQKYLAFHNDLNAGETFFWYSTTGWMMWNFSVSTLLLGGTMLIYDGSPAYPSLDFMWRLASEAPIHHFGTSAPFLVSCMKAGFDTKNENIKLNQLRSIGSTGSPLPDEAFSYVYDHIKKDVWLASISGGTDICTAWVGGNPLLPVCEGEIQCRCLGCAMESWDELGNPILNEVGEMVVTKPMPSMPVFFWKDTDFEKYKSSYFEMYPSVWRHGDWLKVTDRQSLIIYGRSDATLNRQGVRIGTAEIYRVLDAIKELRDALIVNLELSGGEHFMPLFVVCTEGVILDDILKSKIKKSLREAYSPRHVPDDIIAVPGIPYTISGKKLEAPVKKILMGVPLSKAANLGSVRNPSALDFFVEFGKRFAK
ncbi:MAG: acetoacetate--CoA ligase [Saprospiraceae bacterium]|nr:acetoacetate--CoA ligase [Saprospiraceae bacterium]